MPQYKKVFDIGTYTGNGGQYRVGIPTLRGVGPSGKQVANSLRFRSTDSTSLSRTPGSTGNRKTWTWSGWVKRGAIGTGQNWNTLFSAGSYTGSSAHCSFYASGGKVDIISFYQYTGGYQIFYETTAVYKDTSLWYHVVVAVDTTQATAANRVLIYVNGSQVTSFQTSTAPTQNLDTYLNLSGTAGYVGSTDRTSTDNLNGYLSDVNFIDGQQLTPSSFGEYNSDGIWVPKAYSSTYGTNGYNLRFAPGVSPGTDSSGNGNNWTPTGFNVTTSNTTYDIMTDSPTDYLSGSMTTANNAGNYCTLNPLQPPELSTTFSNGNLDFNGAGHCLGTLPMSINTYYEYKPTNANYSAFGVAPVGTTTRNSGAGPTNSAIYATSGVIYVNGSSAGTFASYSTTDTVALTYEPSTGYVSFYKNNVFIATVGVAPSTQMLPYFNNNNLATGSVNFGQRPFTYTPPSGYKALNTYNIPRPADSSLWFYGDTPDLMWIKNRSTAANNVVTDTVRGVGLNLVTNVRAPDLSYPAVSEMNKFGMSIINDSVSIVNGSGNSHIYWTWKANGSSTVTDTSGTITSQVSSNRQAGFSIVSWVYNSSGGTIGHGLGVAPSFIIQRSRTTGYNWDVYHVSIGATKRLTLNTTSASETFTGPWNDTAPTSSVFSSGASWWTNGDNMISYLWAAIPGYSAFGSYTGNGSADGPFVYTGFRPKWIMIKVTSAIDHWILYDTVRSDYNPADDRLFANLTNAESASDNIDILSNGFKLRSSTTVNNTSSGTYIYAAFAEILFKFSRAR